MVTSSAPVFLPADIVRPSADDCWKVREVGAAHRKRHTAVRRRDGRGDVDHIFLGARQQRRVLNVVEHLAGVREVHPEPQGRAIREAGVKVRAQCEFDSRETPPYR